MTTIPLTLTCKGRKVEVAQSLLIQFYSFGVVVVTPLPVPTPRPPRLSRGSFDTVLFSDPVQKTGVVRFAQKTTGSCPHNESVPRVGHTPVHDTNSLGSIKTQERPTTTLSKRHLKIVNDLSYSGRELEDGITLRPLFGPKLFRLSLSYLRLVLVSFVLKTHYCD